MYKQGEGILYRIANESKREYGEEFTTQFGVFKNNNQGEFGGHLISSSGTRISGNFINVFDYKDMVYAIDSLNHMGIAHFNLLVFKSSDEYQTIYHTKDFMEDFENFKFSAMYIDGQEMYIIISGDISSYGKEKYCKDCTKILKVNESVVDEVAVVDESFSFINSLVIIGDYAYVSMDKLVAQIALSSGKVDYYTCLSEQAEENLIQIRKLI